jgi:hypothetical protein
MTYGSKIVPAVTVGKHGIFIPENTAVVFVGRGNCRFLSDEKYIFPH